MQRLYEELVNAERTQHLTRPFPMWTEVCDLPYLDACINEGVRLHPPFCLPFERVVPDGGVTVCGQLIAGGTIVGMSPYVVNRHRPTFGEDADSWRPERWLDQGAEHRKKLENSVLTVRYPVSLDCTSHWRAICCIYGKITVRCWPTGLPREKHRTAGDEETRFRSCP